MPGGDVVTDWDRRQPGELSRTPVGPVPLGTWPPDGNVMVGVLCGIALSLPLWAGLIGGIRALAS
jgi:hypothetical protein